MKRQSLTPAVFVIVLATGGLPAAAQSTDTDNAAPVEVTPYVSLGSYPSSRVGAAIAFRLTPTLSVESEVGYRHDMAGRLSSSASLLYDLPRIGRVMPYLAAGAGLEEYATASDFQTARSPRSNGRRLRSTLAVVSKCQLMTNGASERMRAGSTVSGETQANTGGFTTA